MSWSGLDYTGLAVGGILRAGGLRLARELADGPTPKREDGREAESGRER